TKGGNDFHKLEPPRRVRGGSLGSHLISPRVSPAAQRGGTPRLPPYRPVPVEKLAKGADVPHVRTLSQRRPRCQASPALRGSSASRRRNVLPWLLDADDHGWSRQMHSSL